MSFQSPETQTRVLRTQSQRYLSTLYMGSTVECIMLPRLTKGISQALEHSEKCDVLLMACWASAVCLSSIPSIGHSQESLLGNTNTTVATHLNPSHRPSMHVHLIIKGVLLTSMPITQTLLLYLHDCLLFYAISHSHQTISAVENPKRQVSHYALANDPPCHSHPADIPKKN
ncbi:hypothetical protein ACTXT7_004033 [Hymenolepis weldensis]